MTPQQSIEAECARRGRDAVVAGCVRLISGDYEDASLIVALGGPGAHKFFDGGEHDDEYWFRVWGIRGLLWVFEPEATAAVGTALSDESWRVREMAAKVVARHRLDDLLTAVAVLREDPTPRVRAAAERALMLLHKPQT
jgi:HEAT repeat protein